MEYNNSKYIRMTTELIPKLICTLAVPTIVSMLVTALYNIADTFFVGRVVGATLLAVARQGLMFIPVVLILPLVIDPPIRGVLLAQPTADLFAFALALVLGIRMYRELLRKERGERD